MVDLGDENFGNIRSLPTSDSDIFGENELKKEKKS
jgi:hypothetical protein